MDCITRSVFVLGTGNWDGADVALGHDTCSVIESCSINQMDAHSEPMASRWHVT